MSFERHLICAPKGDHTRARPLTGLLPQTEVLTRKGFKPTSEITPADTVITREHGLSPVLTVVIQHARSRLVRFAAKTLNCDDKTRDLPCDILLPAHQAMRLRDWRAQALFGKHEARVQAAALIDNAYVTDDGMQSCEVVQLWLQTPSTLYLRCMEVLSAHAFDDHLRPLI
ncbi:Hint domain-containing protein [Phaeobacter sp. HF9A]|uniref:Hint domain-containing protein n=1 Tax=Phaeobacter sp. HF9A TaxID=2721561 RepID=UPI0014308A55|nr:Hint domain-containing protein [Phaeobacter sp. HF9A]NIZ15563.1 hypothetical protein [Phaeobacter sp. HF9A]